MWLVIWTWVCWSLISDNDGDISNSVFRSKAGNASIVPVTVPMFLPVVASTKICCPGEMVVFWVVLSSNICSLNFPFGGFSWRVISGNRTMLFARSSVTEYFLKKDIPMRMFPIVGKIMNVSSNTFPPMKKRNSTCFLTGTMFPLAIWTLKSGAGYSSNWAAGGACKMRRSSFSDIALCIAPVSSSPSISYSRN